MRSVRRAEFCAPSASGLSIMFVLYMYLSFLVRFGYVVCFICVFVYYNNLSLLMSRATTLFLESFLTMRDCTEREREEKEIKESRNINT